MNKDMWMEKGAEPTANAQSTIPSPAIIEKEKQEEENNNIVQESDNTTTINQVFSKQPI